MQETDGPEAGADGPPSGTHRVGASLPASAIFPTYHHHNFMLGTARSLVDRQPEAAIAIAQIAFESFVSMVFERLLRMHGIASPLSERLAGVVTPSLMDERTRELWAELTGRRLKAAAIPAWKPYAADHIPLRNKIVHAGGRASPEEAVDSVDAVKALMDAMLAAAQARQAELDPPAGRVAD
jgi:hypothetical protein